MPPCSLAPLRAPSPLPSAVQLSSLFLYIYSRKLSKTQERKGLGKSPVLKLRERSSFGDDMALHIPEKDCLELE